MNSYLLTTIHGDPGLTTKELWRFIEIRKKNGITDDGEPTKERLLAELELLRVSGKIRKSGEQWYPIYVQPVEKVESKQGMMF